jgi:hypothetical protein
VWIHFAVESLGIHVSLAWPVAALLLLAVAFGVWTLAHALLSFLNTS